MRIAIVSDIHGNRRAFDAVLWDLRLVSPDVVVHGGDLAANGAAPAEIIDQIRSLGWLGVRGNTDEMLWDPEQLPPLAARYPKLAPILAALEEMIPVTVERIGQDRLNWLKTLSDQQSIGGAILMHASPNSLWRAPLDKASNAQLEETYGNLGHDIVVYAHIHRPYVRRLGSITVANTGSVSLSYDGDSRASYLVIDGPKITIRRVDYDRQSEAEELSRSGLPHSDWLCRILLSGRYCLP